MVGAAGRMQPDRLAEFVHGREEGFEFRSVERLAGHIAVDLGADRAEIADSALGFRYAGVRSRKRRLGNEGGKAVRILGAQFRKPVIAALRKFERRVRIASRDDLQGRSRQRQNLRIIGELVHHAEALVEIVDRRDGAGAADHVPHMARDLSHQIVIAFRKEVRKRIDPLH